MQALFEASAARARCAQRPDPVGLRENSCFNDRVDFPLLLSKKPPVPAELNFAIALKFNAIFDQLVTHRLQTPRPPQHAAASMRRMRVYRTAVS